MKECASCGELAETTLHDNECFPGINDVRLRFISLCSKCEKEIDEMDEDEDD